MSLPDMIHELRVELYGEIPERLHSSHVPKLLNDDGTTDRGNADEGGLGLPLTAAMHRFIGHWSHWGSSRLGTLSIMEVSDWCNRLHTSHQIPFSSRSLCAEALYHLAHGKEPEELAAQKGLASLHGMRSDQLERMLMNALNQAREWRDGQQSRPKEPSFEGPDPLPYERVVRSTLPRVEQLA